MGKKNLVSEWQKIKCWFGSVTTYKKKKIKDFNYLTNILTPSHMCLDFSLISRIQYVEKKKIIFLLWLIDTCHKKKKKKNLRPHLVHQMEIMLVIEIHIIRNIRCCNRITIYIYIFGLKFDRNSNYL